MHLAVNFLRSKGAYQSVFWWILVLSLSRSGAICGNIGWACWELFSHYYHFPTTEPQHFSSSLNKWWFNGQSELISVLTGSRRPDDVVRRVQLCWSRLAWSYRWSWVVRGPGFWTSICKVWRQNGAYIWSRWFSWTVSVHIRQRNKVSLILIILFSYFDDH